MDDLTIHIDDLVLDGSTSPTEAAAEVAARLQSRLLLTGADATVVGRSVADSLAAVLSPTGILGP